MTVGSAGKRVRGGSAPVPPTRLALSTFVTLSTALALLLTSVILAGPARADWPSWRGRAQTGVSSETGLISKWSTSGENVIWKADLVGRSTPVVFDGRVCANGRKGEGLTKREVVACWDAGTGRKLWEKDLDVYNTTVPFSRVGWANLAIDPETGILYAHGIAGLLVAFDKAGEVVWQRSLTEDAGFLSGFGGRTHSPLVDGDLVILSFVSAGWGEEAPMRGRTFAFDKRTGKTVWVATPGGVPYYANTQTTPVVAVIRGQRLVIEGNPDGWIYALKIRTGEKVWQFHLSNSSINTSVVVGGEKGTTIFAGHSEENIDAVSMGRVVAFDGSGAGDITKTAELWRVEELGMGFPSPLLHGDRLYVIDNSANLFALDAKTGKQYWKHKLGTVGKSSPVWADGKIFATEVNGRVHILKPGADSVESLSVEEVKLPDGRYAEIYGSIAPAYGRLYLSTEAGFFCLGNKTTPVQMPEAEPVSMPAEGPADGLSAPVAALAIYPREVHARPGETVSLTLRAFDGYGRPAALPAGTPEWTLKGLTGTVANGTFVPKPDAGSQAGRVEVKLSQGETAWTAAARVRVVSALPWNEEFEATPVGQNRAWWIGAGDKFVVREMDGGKVLVKPPVPRGLDRSDVYLGPPSLSGYTIQCDLRGSIKGRRRPDMGLSNSGYTLDLMGNHQKLQVRSWSSELRLEKSVEYKWDPDVWYTMKLRVEIQGNRGLIKGKVWPRGQEEPRDWTISAEDPKPIRQGSPGLYGYSAADIFYDNLKVTGNEP